MWYVLEVTCTGMVEGGDSDVRHETWYISMKLLIRLQDEGDGSISWKYGTMHVTKYTSFDWEESDSHLEYVQLWWDWLSCKVAKCTPKTSLNSPSSLFKMVCVRFFSQDAEMRGDLRKGWTRTIRFQIGQSDSSLHHLTSTAHRHNLFQH